MTEERAKADRTARRSSAGAQSHIGTRAHTGDMTSSSDPVAEPPATLNSPDPRESHGRRLTTTAKAAEHYNSAQTHHRDKSHLRASLRSALQADPAFAVAAADLAALDDAHPDPASGEMRTWERHHVEVVAAAADRDGRRAVDLLREHLCMVGCDPVAVAVVIDRAGDEPLDDILDRLPSCHRSKPPRAADVDCR
jgi:hypothetical protein